VDTEDIKHIRKKSMTECRDTFIETGAALFIETRVYDQGFPDNIIE
jgi:hypothetical protein